MTELGAGTIIDGRYQVLGEISRGGMGAVYRVKHRLTGRVEALKLIHLEKAGTESYRKRFLVEATAVARLTCPHTVTLYDCGATSDGLLYFTMELLAGISLSKSLAKEGPVDYRRAVSLVCQACRSLEEAHQKNILHRDVKPSNLFLTNDDEGREILKVLDFGIARFETRTGSLSQTGPQMVVGTPMYMSPEQWIGSQLDARSDLYSLATVLYEMLTGRPPFSADTSLELRAKVLEQLPDPVGVANPGIVIPSELEEVVLACLSKSPADRPASAREFAAGLQENATAEFGVFAARSTVKGEADESSTLQFGTTMCSADLEVPPDRAGTQSGQEGAAVSRSWTGAVRAVAFLSVLVLISLAAALLLPHLSPVRWLDEKGENLRQVLNLASGPVRAVVVKIGHEDDVRTLRNRGFPVPGGDGPKTWRLMDALILRKLADAGAAVVIFDKYYGHTRIEETGKLAEAVRYAARLDVPVAIGILHRPPPEQLVEAGAYYGTVLAAVSGFDGTAGKLLTEFKPFEGKTVPSLFVRAYCLFREPPPAVGEVTDAMLGCERRVLAEGSKWKLRYGEEEIRAVRVSDLLTWQQEEVAGIAKGKVVFVGHVDEGVDEVKVPPVATLSPGSAGKVHGVMLLATAYNQLDVHSGWVPIGRIPAIVLFLLLGILPALLLRACRWPLAYIVSVVLVVGVSLLGVLVPVSYPWGSGLALGLFSSTLFMAPALLVRKRPQEWLEQ